MELFLNFILKLNQFSFNLRVDVSFLFQWAASVARDVSVGQPLLELLLHMHLPFAYPNLAIVILIVFLLGISIWLRLSTIPQLLLNQGIFDQLLFDLHLNRLDLLPIFEQLLVLGQNIVNLCIKDLLLLLWDIVLLFIALLLILLLHNHGGVARFTILVARRNRGVNGGLVRLRWQFVEVHGWIHLLFTLRDVVQRWLGRVFVQIHVVAFRFWEYGETNSNLITVYEYYLIQSEIVII